MPSHHVRRTRSGAIAAAVLVLGLGLAGCTPAGDGGDGEDGGRTESMTVQFVGPPLFGMNPAKTGGGTSILYASAAYDSLFFVEPDGTYSGDLATEWEYVGDDNLAFEMTIREGVVFSDGEELDAEAVKKSLEYTRDGGFFPSVQLASFENIEVTGDYTLRIDFSKPVPNAPGILSQNGVGFIISPAAIDTPDILDTETAGAGPYILNTDETVVGSTYVFDRNETYWNPDAVKVERLIVQAINDPNTILSSIQTGQISISLGNVATAAAAEQAGLEVYQVGGVTHMVTLFDRDGVLVPALADERVRQALNHAVDREGITMAMAGDYGTANGQLVIPGGLGYDEAIDEMYPYDPDLALELLADAGYADGFDLSITCSTLVGSCPTAEAVASDLGKVGVRVTIDEVTGEVQGFDDKLRSATVPAAMQTAGRDFERTAALFGMPSPNPVSNNPFQTADDEISELYDSAVRVSDRAEQGEIWAQTNARMMELAWFVPLFVRSDLYYTQSNVGGFEVTNGNPVYTPVDPVDGSSSWYLTD